MNILAIDSTGNHTSVATKIGDDLLSVSVKHERKMRPDWEDLLDKISITSEDISSFDLFVFGQGPGSYTSIRSVATFMKALSLTHAKPLMALSTLECIAFEHSLFSPDDTNIHCAIMSDIKTEVYYGFFQLKSGQLTSKASETLMNKDDLRKIVIDNTGEFFIGNAWDDIDSNNINLEISSNAATMIELAISKYSDKNPYKPEDANPIYIKETSYKKINDQ